MLSIIKASTNSSFKICYIFALGLKINSINHSQRAFFISISPFKKVTLVSFTFWTFPKLSAYVKNTILHIRDYIRILIPLFLFFFLTVRSTAGKPHLQICCVVSSFSCVVFSTILFVNVFSTLLDLLGN